MSQHRIGDDDFFITIIIIIIIIIFITIVLCTYYHYINHVSAPLMKSSQQMSAQQRTGEEQVSTADAFLDFYENEFFICILSFLLNSQFAIRTFPPTNRCDKLSVNWQYDFLAKISCYFSFLTKYMSTISLLALSKRFFKADCLTCQSPQKMFKDRHVSFICFYLVSK